MPISGRVDARAVKATFAAMPKIVRERMGEAVRVTGSEMVMRAKAGVPVRTGTLRDHIGFSFSPTYCRAKVGIMPGTVVIRGAQKSHFTKASRADARVFASQGFKVYRASHYAHLVEFGDRVGHIKTVHPFMWPAFAGQLGPLESRMRAAQRASILDVANVGSRFA